MKIKYLVKLFLFFFCLQSHLLAQTDEIDSLFWSPDMRSIASPVSVPGWIQLKNEVEIKPHNLFNNYKNAFNLQATDEMVLKKTENTIIQDLTIYRFQQTYKDIPIEGAMYVVHSKNGTVTRVIGKTVQGMNLNVTPSISPDAAVENAINFVPAEIYLWETHDYVLCDSTNQIIDTVYYEYPTTELIFTLKNDDLAFDPKNINLAYKIIIRSTKPYQSYSVYIDANTGNFIKKISLIMNWDNCVNASGPTIYYEQQNFKTQYRGIPYWNYLLKDHCRGDYIQTFYNGNNVTSSDNAWISGTIRPAVTAHWAASMTYDYFYYTFGRNSIDGNGRRLKLNTGYHAKCKDYGYNNAFWFHGDDLAVLCSGDGEIASDFVSLDVIGHEITHGITHYTAKLSDGGTEANALNESFSDIFGKMVEFSYHPDEGSWIIGDDVFYEGGIRSMSDPKSYNNHPDTYLSSYYDDCASPHCRAGIQNFWFYLLSEGGGGINDHNYEYNVLGIGKNKAAAIAYHNLTAFLSSHSTFADAKNGSIFAAMDLFGECSNEVVQTIEAWNAVDVRSAPGFGYNFAISCPIPNWIHYAIGDITVYGYSAPYYDCTISSGSYSILAAGNSIRVTSENLAPGQRIVAREGSYFHAYINPCLSENRNFVCNNTTFHTTPKNQQASNWEKKQTPLNSLRCLFYPNPATNVVNIEISGMDKGFANIEIYNTMGNLIRKETIENNGIFIMNVSGVSQGIYYIRIIYKSAVISEKIIKL
jgi:Zn-dependent metalloprotease